MTELNDSLPVFDYDSVPGESIRIEGEQSPMYDQMPPVVHDVQMENLKPFLMKNIAEAYRDGHLGKTALHYARKLDELNALDSHMLSRLHDLAFEAHEHRHDKTKLEITYSELRELVGNFTVTRRTKR